MSRSHLEVERTDLGSIFGQTRVRLGLLLWLIQTLRYCDKTGLRCW